MTILNRVQAARHSCRVAANFSQNRQRVIVRDEDVISACTCKPNSGNRSAVSLVDIQVHNIYIVIIIHSTGFVRIYKPYNVYYIILYLYRARQRCNIYIYCGRKNCRYPPTYRKHNKHASHYFLSLCPNGLEQSLYSNDELYGRVDSFFCPN